MSKPEVALATSYRRQPRAFIANEYHQLSIKEKRERDLASVREHSVACPTCDTQVMPADLIAHVEQRCTGPRQPGPGSKWITHSEAVAMGVPKQTLSWWARNNQVRFVGERQDRKYLHRDLVLKIAQRRGFRRR